MERRKKAKRRYYAATYVKSSAVLYGTLLFLFARVVRFIQLFQEAAKRKAASQAPPEDYTTLGIVGACMAIVLLLFLLILLLRLRRGRTQLPRALIYLILCGLIAVWGLIQLIGNLIDLFIYPEFILGLDALTAVAALILPPALLTVSDRLRTVPDDSALLFLGIGSIGFSILSFLIVAIVLRESYTFATLMPELLHRAGVLLYGFATIKKALTVRASRPIAEPVSAGRAAWDDAPAYERPRRRSGRDASAYESGDSYNARSERYASAYDARENRYASAYGDARQQRRAGTDADEGRPSFSARDDAYRRQRQAREPMDDVQERLIRLARTSVDEDRSSRRARAGSGSAEEIRLFDDEPSARRGTQRAARTPSRYEEALSRAERIPRQEDVWRPVERFDYSNVDRVTCPECGKRMPSGFPTCPRCGLDMRNV